MRVRRGLLALAAVALLVACAGPPRPPARIVAIGDVHGGYEPFVRLLSAVRLTDADGRWTGGDTTLVQVGDLLDRGPDDRRVLDLLMALEREAAQAGGRVIALLGNHEIMNLIGDWRYVSPEGLASFGGGEARRAALAPDGRYGRWLRSRPAIAQIGGVVFVHGGIAPEVASLGVRGIAERAAGELARVDAERAKALEAGAIAADADLDALLATHPPALADYASWLLGHPAGPFWFRGYAEWSDEEIAARIPAILAALGAEQVVVGHTPQLPAALRVRAGGRVFVIDTGLLGAPTYPGGAPLALEIAGGRFSALDASGARVLLHDAAPGPRAAAR